MGFGNGAFQAARISIDGVTIIQEITTGQVTAAQGSIGMMPSIPADTYANGSIASGFSEYVLTSATSFSINASASWNLPATYGTIYISDLLLRLYIRPSHNFYSGAHSIQLRFRRNNNHHQRLDCGQWRYRHSVLNALRLQWNFISNIPINSVDYRFLG